MSIELSASRVIDASDDHVWRTLTDWHAQSMWIPLTRVTAGPGLAHGVGARIEAWTGIGRIGFLDVMTITVWEPPHRCEVVHTGRIVRGLGVFAVEPIRPERCQVTWEEHLNLSGLSHLERLGWAVAEPLARLGLGLALRRFAAHATRPG